MSKKRRTRAQKQRAAEHRQQLLEQVMPANQPPATAQPGLDQPRSSSRAKTAEPPRPIHRLSGNRRDLRSSLLIFGGLIAAQLAIWLIFHFTTFDSRLYNLIKL